MTITDYRNFDLLITRADDRCRAVVVNAPAGEASLFGQAISLVRLQIRLGDPLQHAVESLATAALAALLDVVQGAQHGNFLSHRQRDELVDRDVIDKVFDIAAADRQVVVLYLALHTMSNKPRWFSKYSRPMTNHVHDRSQPLLHRPLGPTPAVNDAVRLTMTIPEDRS